MNNVQSTLDQLTEIFTATDAELSAWSGEGNLQFPALISTVAFRLGWNEEEIRKNDPLVRYYVRNHPEWHVTRGAHGGIQRKSEKDKKDATKAAQKVLKDQIKAAIDAKVSETQ